MKKILLIACFLFAGNILQGMETSNIEILNYSNCFKDYCSALAKFKKIFSGLELASRENKKIELNFSENGDHRFNQKFLLEIITDEKIRNSIIKLDLSDSESEFEDFNLRYFSLINAQFNLMKESISETEITKNLVAISQKAQAIHKIVGMTSPGFLLKQSDKAQRLLDAQPKISIDDFRYILEKLLPNAEIII